MLDQFKRLGRHSMIYGLSNALAASMSLLLLPLLTRHLQPSEYGALDLALVFAAQLAIVLQLGFGSAVFKFMSQRSVNEAEPGRVVSTAYYTIAAVALVTTSVLGLFSGGIANVLMGSPGYRTAVIAVLIKAGCEGIGVIPMARLRIREESIKYGALNVGRLVFSVVMFSVILIWMRGGFRGVMIGVALESVVFASVSSLTAWSDLGSGYSLTTLRGMLAFGLPLVPLAFGLTALSVGDRYVLRQFSDLEEVGRYSVANKIAAALNIVIRAFQVAWPAVMFSSASRPDATRFYARLLTYLVFVLALAGLAVSVFARELVALLAPPSFRAAFSVVPILALAQIALGLFYVTAVGSNLTGKTHLQTISVMVALAVFLAACYLLIPNYKMTGAAIASALGYATLTATSCMLSLRVYAVQYEWGRVALLLLIAAALSVAGFSIVTRSLLLDIIIKTAVVALYPAVLFVVGFMDDSERRVLQRFSSAVLRRAAVFPRPGSP